MNLSAAQANVIERLRTGWNLGKSKHIGSAGSYVRLQQNGLGKGGKTESVSRSTLDSLLTKGLIKAGPFSFIQTEYFLTEAGKTISLPSKTK